MARWTLKLEDGEQERLELLTQADAPWATAPYAKEMLRFFSQGPPIPSDEAILWFIDQFRKAR